MKFSSNNIYTKENYTIEYALVITERDYNDLNKLVYKAEKEGFESGEEIYGGGEYIGRTSYYKIIIKEELTTLNCNNDNEDICSLCVDNNLCIVCKYGFNFKGFIKTCKEKEVISSTSPILTTIPSTTFLTIKSTSPNSFYTSLLPENMTITTSPIISTSPNSFFSSLPSENISIATSPIISTNPNIISLTSSPTSFISNVNFLSTTILSTNSNSQKISSEISLISPSSIPFLINGCTEEQILNNKCNEGKMTDKQI